MKPPRSSTLAIVLLALAFLVGASVARAQISVRSSRSDTASVASGSVFTAPFAILNKSQDSALVSGSLVLPKGWAVINSPAPASVAANGMELWLVSMSVPDATPAGTYAIRATVRSGEATVTDSTIVTVAERRELEIRAVNPPTYVLTGESYDVSFIVNNHGNVATRVALKLNTNHGVKPVLSRSLLTIAGGASATVIATVAIPTDINHSVQDVLEILGIDQTVDSVRAETSVETTIVPNGNIGDEYWTVPATVALRAAPAGTGVSAFVASGSGRLTEKSDVNVDFAFQSKPSGVSLFGEREQYRLGLSNQNASLRLGDNSFGFSMLTSSGSQSTGAELRGTTGNLVEGAYVQHNRWTPNAATEMAAMVGTTTNATTSGSLILLDRAKAGMNAQVAAGTAKTALLGTHVELEGAASDSNSASGGAGVLRVYGNAPTFTYDVGGQRGSNDFAGSQRAATDIHLSLSGQRVGAAMLSAMTSVHQMNPTALSNGFGQRIATSMVTANFTNGTAVELERFDRADRGTTTGVHGHQNSLRVRGGTDIGKIELTGDVQEGLVSQADSANSRAFSAISLSGRAEIARDQYVSLFTDLTDGRSLGAGGVGTLTSGGNADVRLAQKTTLRMTGAVTAQRDRMSAWVGQGDVTVEQTVRQSIVALRARISQSGAASSNASNAVYLEVRTPLHVPTSHLDLGGRAHAQVVDAETGNGIEGALVRLGEQAAITDKHGNAYFKGLQMGDYHAVVDGGAAAGRIMTSGNEVRVNSKAPVGFLLKLGRGARIGVRLHHFERNSAAAPNAVDSVIDMGGISQTVVALISAKDTIWQTSDDRGHIDFGSVAPGHYKVAVVAGEIPEFMAYENKEVAIDVTAGEERQVEMRMLPVARPVEMMAEETVLVAAPAVAQPAPSVNRPRPIATPTPRGQRNDQKDQ
jgi:hypothetical protein